MLLSKNYSGVTRVIVLGLVLIAFLSVTAAAQTIIKNTPPDLRMRWYEEHAAKKESTPFNLPEWSFIGPTGTSGRCTDVAIVTPRGQNYIVFMAAASGGVWRTKNEGVTWEPVFEEGPSTSIGDVTIAPSNPDIVWIGTGEANIFRSSMAGFGVYKSTDGGDTWQHMGLAGTNTIPRIVIHPTNPNIVYVAASGTEWTWNEDRGIYKTTNGGRTWEKVFYINERAGAIDLVMDPEDTNTLYASTWERIRRHWNDPRVEPGMQHSGVWKSTDGGSNWDQINNGLPEPQHRGRIGIDVSLSNPDVLYAFVDNYEIGSPARPGQTDSYGRPVEGRIKGSQVYRSDNKGSSWRLVSGTDIGGVGSTYGWVFGQIRVDPNNEDKIFIMGLGLNMSEDAGQTWRSLRGMHGDHHALWIDPDNSDFLVNGNDGGIYFSYDGGANWRNFTDKIPVVQFFNIMYDMGSPFKVYGSVQDHGSRSGEVIVQQQAQRGGRQAAPQIITTGRGMRVSGAAEQRRFRVTSFSGAPGGEGSSHAIDPTNPNIVYSAGFYGSISRTDLSAGGRSVSIVPQAAPGENPLRGQWVAPFIISPHNPKVIYHGMQYLYRSEHMGDTFERISPDLTYNNIDEIGDIPYQTLFAISESPLKAGLVYAGTDDGRVWVTKDDGENWTEIVNGLPYKKWVSRLAASKFDLGTVYMSQNGKREDDFAPYLWKSTNFGQTWQDISDGIPIGPINVVREDPTNRNILYVGTDIGVYVTVDGGSTWEVLGGNLPSTFVSDLVVHPRENVIVISTHGRGVWALDAAFFRRQIR
ncbi:WD40/YVTN/BNR-like repeat-containing protein [candidate division KSB1 bacterium]